MTIRIFSHFKKYLHAYIIGLIGFLISLGLFYGLQVQEDRHILNIAQLGIETLNNALRSELAFDTQILKHLATTETPMKTGHTADILRSYPRFYALAEIGPALQLNWIATQNTPGVDQQLLLRFIHQNEQKIPTLKTPWVSSPISLPNKNIAFFMIYPGKTAYLIALIDSDSLFYHSSHIPGMIFDVYLNHQDLSQNAEQGDQSWLFEISQDLDGATWNIKAREETLDFGIFHFISHEAPLSWITLLLGLFISILLARSIALSDLLKERTVILDKINQDLKHEITDHIQTEESKKNLEKALLQGQKLQAIGTLAGGIAHDFNNILYAIRGYVELARDELPKDAIAYKNLGKVLEGTFRGQDLIARILSFSRRQHHEHSPLRLKTEIEGALSLLRPTVPETVALDFHATTEGKILGNKTQIHQVIVNLINNAVDAMDSEGTITLSLSHGSEKGVLQSENYCKIEVSDTGQGMDQSTVERIFEPFFTTKEVGKGTGLGLSTVHSIVKEHNGEVIVHSQVGKGTTFTLLFPEHTGSYEDVKHG